MKFVRPTTIMLTTREIAAELGAISVNGHAVVKLDDHQVATFLRIHHEARPLLAGESLLRFKKHGQVVRVASEDYFFQEGHAGIYQSARYGEVRVNDAGKSVLVGLRDAEFRRMDAASTDAAPQ